MAKSHYCRRPRFSSEHPLGDQALSSDLRGHQAYTCVHVYMQVKIHRNKIKIFIERKTISDKHLKQIYFHCRVETEPLCASGDLKSGCCLWKPSPQKSHSVRQCLSFGLRLPSLSPNICCYCSSCSHSPSPVLPAVLSIKYSNFLKEGGISNC